MLLPYSIAIVVRAEAVFWKGDGDQASLWLGSTTVIKMELVLGC